MTEPDRGLAGSAFASLLAAEESAAGSASGCLPGVTTGEPTTVLAGRAGLTIFAGFSTLVKALVPCTCAATAGVSCFGSVSCSLGLFGLAGVGPATASGTLFVYPENNVHGFLHRSASDCGHLCTRLNCP